MNETNNLLVDYIYNLVLFKLIFKKMKKKFYAAAIMAACGLVGYGLSSSNETQGNLSNLTSANITALADNTQEEYIEGTCFGCGPGFTDIHCPGGKYMCGLSHGDVYGKKRRS